MSRESGSISLAAPAKINLSLRIMGKRPDGFHDLETLMVPIALADEVEISHAPEYGISLTCNDPDIPTGSDNLCVKAVEAFRKETGIAHGIAISLMKRIPHGAGLGGGSSDAAAVLRGMNELFDHPLVAEELALLAAGLGSDVPFFLHDCPTVCRGRGEILEEAPAIPERRILLIKPPFPVATAWAYNRYAEMRESRMNLTQDPPQHLGPIDLVNDLEPPVFEKYLLLQAMKQWLLEQSAVESAFMTGSGSTMVAVIKPVAGADEIPELKANILTEFGETMRVMEARLDLNKG
jgi:4-diphosphocytidyl-2-C-methyl-D-erythritol kinase